MFENLINILKCSLDDTDQRKKPLMSFDINCEGKFLCGGTEKVNKDSFLFLWDVRSSKVLKKYTEVHEDDVSHVSFQSYILFKNLQ